MSNKDKSIVLFDGVCNLCNSVVQFLIVRDKKKKLFYSALQSSVGQEILRDNGLNTSDFDSFILQYKGEVYSKSSAGIRVLSQLGGLWPMMKVFLIVPKPIRDWVYSLIANNRYKWWGKKDHCMMPTPEMQSRFVK